jgi:hypothetical protein
MLALPSIVALWVPLASRGSDAGGFLENERHFEIGRKLGEVYQTHCLDLLKDQSKYAIIFGARKGCVAHRDRLLKSLSVSQSSRFVLIDCIIGLKALGGANVVIDYFK